MMGSGVRVPASALRICRRRPAYPRRPREPRPRRPSRGRLGCRLHPHARGERPRRRRRPPREDSTDDGARASARPAARARHGALNSSVRRIGHPELPADRPRGPERDLAVARHGHRPLRLGAAPDVVARPVADAFAALGDQVPLELAKRRHAPEYPAAGGSEVPCAHGLARRLRAG